MIKNVSTHSVVVLEMLKGKKCNKGRQEECCLFGVGVNQSVAAGGTGVGKALEAGVSLGDHSCQNWIWHVSEYWS